MWLVAYRRIIIKARTLQLSVGTDFGQTKVTKHKVIQLMVTNLLGGGALNFFGGCVPRGFQK